MESKIASAIALTNHPVALVWADAAPEGAVSFKPGRWGCVMSVFAAGAAKARVGAFDRQTYGCWESIGAFAYRELENQHPRAVVGLTDISARNAVRPVLVRIPLKWGTDSGEVGQRRSEATPVTAMISELPHMSQEFCW